MSLPTEVSTIRVFESFNEAFQYADDLLILFAQLHLDQEKGEYAEWIEEDSIKEQACASLDLLNMSYQFIVEGNRVKIALANTW